MMMSRAPQYLRRCTYYVPSAVDCSVINNDLTYVETRRVYRPGCKAVVVLASPILEDKDDDDDDDEFPSVQIGKLLFFFSR